MKTKILKCLRENKGYVSGQELCERFQVSRTAVWKVIHQLQEEGYQIEAIRNKGYRIVESPDVMTKEEIESLIKTNWVGREVFYYEEIDSTNAQAKRLAEQAKAHGALFVAEMQSTGKGRRGRSWESPKGTGIWMSLLLRPEIAPSKAPMLTLVMAYSVAMAIREIAEQDVEIKWPNDIVLHGKKICGILTEMSAEIDFINHVVIGVGINVNTTEFPKEIASTATSLKNEGGKKIKRGELIACIMSHFEKNYEAFIDKQDLSELKDAYNGLLVNCNREVKVLTPGHEYQALALGINELGELLVKKDDGTLEAIFAGEVSVRGIYGYI